MGEKIAGTLFIRNGITHDYCFVEAINSLLEATDQVFVVDAGSVDGTLEILEKMPIELITSEAGLWEEMQSMGRERLAWFTNIAIQAAKSAGYKWQFNLQADEIIHERSYPYIRRAIERHGSDHGVMCVRHNLWGSSGFMLDVAQERKPCSTEIIRLTQTNRKSVGDAESIDAPCKWLYDEIEIFHMGFVRNKHKMIGKVINMQQEVFQMGGYDQKLDQMTDGFDPWVYFSKSDVIQIPGPLPKLIQEWSAQRDAINQKTPTDGPGE
jgi:hypothetical protein